MKASYKISIAIFAVILIILAYFGYRSYKKQTANSPVATSQDNSGDTAQSPVSQQIDNAESNSQATDDNSNNSSLNNDTQPSDNSPANTNIGGDIAASNSKKAPTVSAVPTISGNMLAHITPQHCADNCQAFASDLSLLEYCQEACGISPVKNVANCDGQKDIQKDYCLKDLAIGKEDASKCSAINDANILQSCKNRIEQDSIENQIENQQNNNQAPSN